MPKLKYTSPGVGFLDTRYVNVTGDESIAGVKTFTGQVVVQGDNSALLQLEDADGNPLAVADTVLGRFGIATASPTQVVDIAYGHLAFTQVPNVSVACVGALAGLGAGNVDNGDHYYRYTYVTAYGETQVQGMPVSNKVTVTDKTVDGQVNLTGIAVSTNPLVTSRKIYRTKVASASPYYLLTTINNNTATTYTDNTADANLGTTDVQGQQNTTAGRIYLGSSKVFGTFGTNTSTGLAALTALTSASYATALGGYALTANTSGSYNTAVGAYALAVLSTGGQNTAVGYYAGYNNNSSFNVFVGHGAGTSMTGQNNTVVGREAGQIMTTGNYNVFIGHEACHSTAAATSLDNNVCIGFQAGYGLTTGSDGNVMLGYQAGYSETGSNTLYIDNSNTTTPLIYGNFSTNVLRIYGNFGVGIETDGDDPTFTMYGYTADGVLTWMEDEDYFKFSDDIMLVGGENIVLDTTTGTKIGTTTSQLLGFYNATPVNQPDTVADPTNLDTCITSISAIIDRLQELGLIA